jgi:hypothetical protein
MRQRPKRLEQSADFIPLDKPKLGGADPATLAFGGQNVKLQLRRESKHAKARQLRKLAKKGKRK